MVRSHRPATEQKKLIILLADISGYTDPTLPVRDEFRMIWQAILAPSS